MGASWARLVVCRPLLGAALVAGGLGGCGTDAGGPRPGPVSVNVSMRDFAFDYTPVEHPGRVVFIAHNAGKEPHELYVLPLPEDLPPLREQLEGDVRQFLAPLARVRARPPGGTGRVAVDLVPGRYALACFVKGGDGTAHVFKGMTSEFRVREPREATSSSRPRSSIGGSGTAL